MNSDIQVLTGKNDDDDEGVNLFNHKMLGNSCPQHKLFYNLFIQLAIFSFSCTYTCFKEDSDHFLTHKQQLKSATKTVVESGGSELLLPGEEFALLCSYYTG